MAGGVRLLVRADGGRVLRRGGGGEPSSLLVETALGPALVLALALQETWCLHAGAAVFAGRAIALAGDSGAGKSTLAAALGRRGGPWRRAADDLLPVAFAGGRPFALPRIPQARLSPDAQPGACLPERLPLAAIYLLAPAPPDAPTTVMPVPPRRAALALVRHTFASCLFDAERRARHLTFCAELAAGVPVRTLVVPRRLDSLAAVGDAIEADLATPERAAS